MDRGNGGYLKNVFAYKASTLKFIAKNNAMQQIFLFIIIIYAKFSGRNNE